MEFDDAATVFLFRVYIGGRSRNVSRRRNHVGRRTRRKAVELGAGSGAPASNSGCLVFGMTRRRRFLRRFGSHGVDEHRLAAGNFGGEGFFGWLSRFIVVFVVVVFEFLVVVGPCLGSCGQGLTDGVMECFVDFLSGGGAALVIRHAQVAR